MEGEEFGTSWNILDPDFVQDLAEAEAGVIAQSLEVSSAQGMNKMTKEKNLRMKVQSLYDHKKTI